MCKNDKMEYFWKLCDIIKEIKFKLNNSDTSTKQKQNSNEGNIIGILAVIQGYDIMFVNSKKYKKSLHNIIDRLSRNC